MTNPTIVLDYTGERMVPELCDGDTFWEHVYRYRFAVQFAPGLRVLDIASGEGYGTAAFVRAGAATVTGVDISETACVHARTKYGVDVRLSDGTTIPVGDSAVDLVVSFETIEHVERPQDFIAEIARVLAPGGILIVSTPNVHAYSPEGASKNPFHCSEMDARDLQLLLSKDFVVEAMYGQRVVAAPWWRPSSLLLPQSAWQKWRLGRVLRRALVPLVVTAWQPVPKPSERKDPVRTILDGNGSTKSLLHPYGIRELSDSGSCTSLYVVAVARRQPLSESVPADV